MHLLENLKLPISSLYFSVAQYCPRTLGFWVFFCLFVCFVFFLIPKIVKTFSNFLNPAGGFEVAQNALKEIVNGFILLQE